jgi:transcriptional regulator with XRE-family HTH domain
MNTCSIAGGGRVGYLASSVERHSTRRRAHLDERTYGARQRELRLDRGMSLRQLAEAATAPGDPKRLDFTYLGRIEQGIFPPPSEQVIVRIARALTPPGEPSAPVEAELLALAHKPHPEAVEAVTALPPEGLDFLRAVRESRPGAETWRRLREIVERDARPETEDPGA